MKTRSITAAVRPALSQTPAWVLDLATIRRLEGRWLDETEPGELMACAGAAVARVAMAMWKNLPAHAPVILLVGPGNNGGDALVAGRILRRAGLAVWAVGMPGLDTTPPEAEDARAAWEAWRADGQAIHGFEQVADWLWPDGDAPDDDGQDDDDGDVPPAEPALIIDGLFGIGLTRPLAGRVAGLVRRVNRARVPVLAIDVPSGLDADRGAPVGDAEAPVMQARQTVTMIADKPGLHTGAGLRHAGRVWVAPLSDLPLEAELDALEAADGPADAGKWRDVPTEAEAETDPDDGHNFDDSGMDDADVDAPCPADEDSFPHELPGVLLTAPLAAALLPARARDAHKGNGGDVLVVGGRLGMAGAARLAAQGAAGAGAGRVWIAVEPELALGQRRRRSPDRCGRKTMPRMCRRWCRQQMRAPRTRTHQPQRWRTRPTTRWTTRPVTRPTTRRTPRRTHPARHGSRSIRFTRKSCASCGALMSPCRGLPPSWWWAAVWGRTRRRNSGWTMHCPARRRW